VGPNSHFLPLVKAITVESASTISIKYVSGTWCDNANICGIGPNGFKIDLGSSYGTPLQEALGLVFGTVTDEAALIGAFVPESLVNTPGFQALDGTKLASGVGIMPNRLFFVGTYNVITGGRVPSTSA
jgi:hypothetical protein